MKKLNAQEIRIGNYVNAEVKLPSLLLHKILAMDIPEILNERAFCYGVDLTESWLLKFGFEKITDYQFRKGKRLIMKREYIFYDYGTDVKIEFVHKLQNLYFELNEDLPII